MKLSWLDHFKDFVDCFITGSKLTFFHETTASPQVAAFSVENQGLWHFCVAFYIRRRIYVLQMRKLSQREVDK